VKNSLQSTEIFASLWRIIQAIERTLNGKLRRASVTGLPRQKSFKQIAPPPQPAGLAGQEIGVD
jgi:hypothetical protein